MKDITKHSADIDVIVNQHPERNRSSNIMDPHQSSSLTSHSLNSSSSAASSSSSSSSSSPLSSLSPVTDLSSLLSILIVTSPIPIHPSTEVIDLVIRSFDTCHPLLSTVSNKLIICDGVKTTFRDKPAVKNEYKSGRITPQKLVDYNLYKKQLHIKYSNNYHPSNNNSVNTPIPPTDNPLGKYKIIELNKRFGFAFAIKEALLYVSTPYILIIQHDYSFVASLPIPECLNIISEPSYQINHIAFMSSSTMDYYQKSKSHFRFDHDPSHSLLEYNGLIFSPLLFLYDRNHITSVHFLKNKIFKYWSLKRGDFIEDVVGHIQMKEIKKKGMEGWKEWGSIIYYPNQGKELSVALKHVHGRRYVDREIAALFEERSRSRQETEYEMIRRQRIRKENQIAYNDVDYSIEINIEDKIDKVDAGVEGNDIGRRTESIGLWLSKLFE